MREQKNENYFEAMKQETKKKPCKANETLLQGII